MSIVAKYSNYRLTNLKIAVAVLIVISIWCAYDGYFNEKFIEKHTRDGKPDDTLIFHEKFPYFGVVAAFGVAGSFVHYRKKKVVAEDDAIVISDCEKIPYDAIDEIDHTEFDDSGKFTVKYHSDGGDKTVVLSRKKWDDLEKVLEFLIAKIS
jgi:hypothetical protein